jgi:Rrf2 family protein
MKFSTRTRYGLRFLVYLALRRDAGGYVQLKQVAEDEGISMKYLEQIARLLKRTGLLTVSRGAYGGYSLSRPPDDITLKEVFIGLEGSLSPVGCLDGKLECAKFGRCETLGAWRGLETVMSEYLEGISLGKLVDEWQEKTEPRGKRRERERSAVDVR